MRNRDYHRPRVRNSPTLQEWQEAQSSVERDYSYPNGIFRGVAVRLVKRGGDWVAVTETRIELR